ncbi:DUF4280 domain-containing protein [Nitriliruptor alkaliphilus]|uniref:DUF4280 domain-containing protein n=1 Tax=Nitriliruptor alkaliphilus TaxID=427918 RepID=UPI0006960243|nr:DUF4280 domain-containing protein [Nitriliruptor alkaliphilus]
MGQNVVSGAQMLCSFGVAPSALNVLPSSQVLGGGPPAGTIQDNKPLVNIPPFGMCMSLSNPTVAAATAAALGVLTPMPCIPSIPAPWMPGSPTVQIGGQPALESNSKLTCAYGGVIQLLVPGQFTVTST